MKETCWEQSKYGFRKLKHHTFRFCIFGYHYGYHYSQGEPLKMRENEKFEKFIHVFQTKIHKCGLPQWYPKFYDEKIWVFSFLKTCQEEFYDNLNHSEMYLNLYENINIDEMILKIIKFHDIFIKVQIHLKMV